MITSNIIGTFKKPAADNNVTNCSDNWEKERTQNQLNQFQSCFFQIQKFLSLSRTLNKNEFVRHHKSTKAISENVKCWVFKQKEWPGHALSMWFVIIYGCIRCRQCGWMYEKDNPNGNFIWKIETVPYFLLQNIDYPPALYKIFREKSIIRLIYKWGLVLIAEMGRVE